MHKFLRIVRQSPFIRHNAVFFAGSLGVAALNYLYYPILGRLMEPAEFGEVQAALSLFLQSAIFLSILTYVTVYVTVNAADAQERSRGLMALEQVALVVGGIALGVSLLLAGVLRDFFNFSSAWPFVALIAALFVSIPLNMRMAYLRGSKQYLRSSVTDGIGSAVKLILSPVLVVIGFSSFGAVLGLTLSQLVSLSFAIWWAHQAGMTGLAIKRSRMDFSILRPQLRYAMAVFLASGSTMVLMSVDILAVKHYFSPEQAGLYAGMVTVARIIFFLTTPFTAVMLTMISFRAPAKKNRLWLKGTLALTLGIGVPAVLMIGLGARLFIQLLVGAKYLAYAGLMPRLCLVMLLLGIANLLVMYHVALRRFWFAIIAVAVTIFTLILVGLRHNAIAQVINDVLIGSSVLVAVVVGATLIRTRTERSGGWTNKAN
jgi:O-antigen/teichoic acid export membrane protein